LYRIIEQYTKDFVAEKAATKPGRWAKSARDAVHEALESFAVEMFQDSVLVTTNRKRSTTTLGDLMTANTIKRIPRGERSWHEDRKNRLAEDREERVENYLVNRDAALRKRKRQEVFHRRQKEALRRKARSARKWT
jgi:histone H3/H4